MTTFMIGMLLFFGSHSLSLINAPWRDRMAARLGELQWKLLYSLVALLGLYLLISGYGEARTSARLLYDSPRWLAHLAALLMVPVFPLLLAAYLPGRLQRWFRHPMLVAVKLWAIAHLLTNGRSVDLLLFGGFLLWAVLVRLSYRWREPRPVSGLAQRARHDWIALLVGLGLYALFLTLLHGRLIGVSPLG